MNKELKMIDKEIKKRALQDMDRKPNICSKAKDY